MDDEDVVVVKAKREKREVAHDGEEGKVKVEVKNVSI